MKGDGIITNLKHYLLLATPQLEKSRFDHTVIYVCAHNDEGAMGLIINRPLPHVTFEQIVSNMGLASAINAGIGPMILNGGPVEPSRGFVVHSDDYAHDSSVPVGGHVNLSATSDIVSAIATGRGPEQVNFCLGYAGWGPNQLEDEIAENSWLVLPADDELLFKVKPAKRYEEALRRLRLNEWIISGEIGLA